MSPLPSHVRVVTSYVSSAPEPVRFRTGEAVVVGRHDQQWTSYVWGTDEAGRAGWVPEEYLQPTGASEAVALRDYDATELTVARGERLEVLSEAGGWLLCRTVAGLTGWVPSDHVEPLG
jgi:uncharacterized protein YgiM (DUF1202 family)